MVNIDDKSLREELRWLIDVSMFIDRQRVEQLYDITIQPIFEEYREDLSSRSKEKREADTVTHMAQAEAAVGLPWFSDFSLKGMLGRDSSETEEKSGQSTYTITQRPQRQLLEIAFHTIVE